jgi:hypothetical protein
MDAEETDAALSVGGDEVSAFGFVHARRAMQGRRTRKRMQGHATFTV